MFAGCPHVVLIFLALFCLTAFGEAPLAFRERICSPHEAGRRDRTLKPSADEFVLRDGMSVCVPEEPLAVRAAEDFIDYCKVSMNLDVRRGAAKGKSAGIRLEWDKSLPPRTSKISIGRSGVRIRAVDGCAALQAFFHLEDLMNLRCAPYLKFGTETRRQKFSPRMAWSGLGGSDPFPDGHLSVLAHAGFDAILNPLKGVDQILAGKEKTDVNDIIDRASAWGLDAYFLSHIKALKHPDDPGSAAELARTYGAVVRKHPRIRGFVLVPECNYFESRDPRVSSKDSKTDANGKPKPAPSRFPCSDYPQWLKGVEKTIRAEIPDVDFVFWTYNFHWAPEADRFALIDNLAPSTILNVTFALGNWREHKTRIGLCSPVDDYSISTPGPSQLFRAEAARAHARNLRLFTTCNTGGRTWDFGCCPYEPVPFQWKLRYEALEKARTEWGLSGLIETWQYGFMPNFIAELTKEAFTEGGMPFEEHLRRIAVRDFGERNADAVVAVWKDFSEAICDYTAMGVNQYGPFRVGPAYPFNALGPFLKFRGEWPGFTSWICNPNYGWTIPWSGGEPKRMALNLKHLVPEIQLFREAGAKFLSGAEKLQACAANLSGERRRRAQHEAGVGAYIGRSFLTAANVKDAVIAERTALDEQTSEADRKSAKEKIWKLARDEYANTQAALELVQEDSRLGWLDGSSQYAGGVDRIEWKLRHMEKLYDITPSHERK